VRGASTTANELIATTRPLASADRPAASATASDTPIGNRLPSPIPISDRPIIAGAGAVDGHRIANPAAVIPSAIAKPRRTVPAGSRLPSVRPTSTPRLVLGTAMSWSGQLPVAVARMPGGLTRVLPAASWLARFGCVAPPGIRLRLDSTEA